MAMIAITALARAAAGQDITDIAGPFGLPIPAAALERYGKILNLDNDQKQTARVLYQGYRGALRQTIVETNQALKAVEEVEPTERGNKGMQVLDSFADKHQKVEQEFFTDLKAILKPEQEGALEAVLRARRREVQMRFAFVAGEGADLVLVLDKIKASPAKGTELASAVAEYEEAIDHLMVEKQKLMRASLQRAFKLQKNGMPDVDLISSILTDIFSVGTRIRDTNRKFVRIFEPMLSEDARTALTSEFRTLSFPRVYARTLADKMLVAAKEMPELTPSQAEDLKTIHSQYTRDLEAANQRYAAAIESTQERVPKEFMIIMQLRNAPGSDDPLLKAREERNDLEQKVFAKLRAMFKPEDFQKLPQTDSDHSRFPEFLPNFSLKKELDAVTGDNAE